MPLFRLFTNIPREKVPKNFLVELTDILSATVGKPKEQFVVHIVTDQLMVRGGTTEPCATASLMSIGKLGPTENIKHSKVLFEKICKDLGIPKERMFIEFKDMKDFEIGAMGTTVHAVNNM